MLENKINIEHLDNYKKYISLKHETEKWLTSNGYLSLDLPTLSPVLIPEESIEVFETELHNHTGREKLYLTPSPELFIKVARNKAGEPSLPALI